jgi:predicted MFS family arabinose efflux permease
VAADRAVEAFTWLTTANAAGVAAGAALAGQLTHTSESAALLLVCGGAALAAGIAIGRRATLTPRDDSAQPRPDSGRPVMTASTSP